LQGSNNDSDWTDIYNGQHANTTDIETYTFSNSTAYRYYRIYITTQWESADTGIVEVEMMEKNGLTNMTLISDTFTADEQPDDARIIIFEEDVDSITLNTDIKAYASRDDGTTWTQITLSDEGTYSGTKRILSGTADISGQPSGTNMKYKIETLNNKNLKLHGAALSWA